MCCHPGQGSRVFFLRVEPCKLPAVGHDARICQLGFALCLYWLHPILAFQGMLTGRAGGILSNPAESSKWLEKQGKNLQAAFGDLQVTGEAAIYLVRRGHGQRHAARAHPTLWQHRCQVQRLRMTCFVMFLFAAQG